MKIILDDGTEGGIQEIGMGPAVIVVHAPYEMHQHEEMENFIKGFSSIAKFFELYRFGVVIAPKDLKFSVVRDEQPKPLIEVLNGN